MKTPRHAKITNAAILALGLSAIVTSPAFAANLTIEVSGEVGDKGAVLVALYKASDKWMGKATDIRRTAAVKSGVAVTFNDLADGEYAISLFIDENSNGKLDTNAVGMPIEPYAFSNDASGTFGPPSFDKAKFVLGKDDKKHVITIK